MIFCHGVIPIYFNYIALGPSLAIWHCRNTGTIFVIILYPPTDDQNKNPVSIYHGIYLTYVVCRMGRWSHTYYPTNYLFARVRPESNDTDNKRTTWPLNRVQLLLAIWQLMKWLSSVMKKQTGLAKKTKVAVSMNLARLHRQQRSGFTYSVIKNVEK